jgi:hypothetical protein
MAVTYGFYNSLNKDRVYNAEQMSSIFNGIITDGVFASIGGSLMPIAGTGMQVVVKTGKCWFNSTWTLNDALLPLDIPAADVSLTRIDAVVVEINSAVSTRANTIKVIKGTPSANPAKPTLANTETLHQYALGYVTVSAGVTSITADKIEVNVGKTTCPFITSVLQQTDITDLFNQWEAEFTAWFENVQAQLSGNVAANLQRQIDENYANTLKNSTKSLLGLSSDAVPDDAFLCLIVGSGFYGYRIKVLLSNGEPVEAGIKINGLTALNGEPLYTDANGQAFGKSTSQSINISVESPYIDQSAPTVKTVQSTGVITDAEIHLVAITDIIKISESKQVKYSAAKSVDICIVGGGGGGCGAADSEYQKSQGGGGGGGGNITNVLAVSLISYLKKNMNIIVGAGGAAGVFSSTRPSGNECDGSDGGTTSVIIGEQVEIGRATGGGGGKIGLANAAPGAGGTSINGGAGGAGGYGGSYETYRGLSGASSIVHIFNDASLGLAGGGGGAGGGYFDSAPRASGGSPNGGLGGAYIWEDGSWSDYHADPGLAFGGGGGGERSGRSNGNNHGGAGGVYLRFHFL